MQPASWVALLGFIATLHGIEAGWKLKNIYGQKLHKPAAADDEGIALNEIEDSDDLALGIPDETQIDPCLRRHCDSGKVCKLSEDGEPLCLCIEECLPEVDPRRKVCSNLNKTWSSDCELNQMRCWCQEDDPRCQSKDLAHHHVDYYGSCKTIQECLKEEMEDFPRRMRDWLFHVMRDMADREELSPHYLKLEREAELDQNKRWTNAAVWKWCDLDSARDRFVSRHELFPLRAPLVALEHCIAPFLDSCDSNSDSRITLKEWAECLELNEEDIEEKCEDIRNE